MRTLVKITAAVAVALFTLILVFNINIANAHTGVTVTPTPVGGEFTPGSAPQWVTTTSLCTGHESPSSLCGRVTRVTIEPPQILHPTTPVPHRHHHREHR